MWMDIGWGLYFRVVGTHKHYMSSSKFFPQLVVGALKPSITFISLASLPLAPSCSPLAPLSLPSHSSRSLLLPSLPLAPLSLPLLSHSFLPLAPTEVVGTQKHSITYPYPTLAIGSKRKQEGSERGREGVRGVRRSEREQAGRNPWPNRAGGHPKTCHHKWWGPQNIPVDHHYALPPLSQLWVRGESWEQGEGLLVQEKWWTPQKLTPQVVGTPKHTPRSPLPPTSILLPLAPSHPLSLPGPLRTSWGLRKPWKPLEAFGSLGSSVRLRGLASPAPTHLPLLPLTPSHPLSPPEPPWVSLGPWDLPGASESLGSLWKPFAALGLQSDLFPLLPCASPCSLLLPLTPSHPCEPP